MMPGNYPEPVAFHPGMSRLPPIFERLIGLRDYTGSAVLLVAGEDARSRGWGGTAAIALAGLIGERGRRVILADLALDAPELHGLLDQANDEGVTDMLLFGASLNYVARRAPDAAFHFAPAGAYAAEPRTVFEHGRWDDMLRGAQNDNALLLLYVPAEIEGVDAIAARVRRAIILAASQEEMEATAARLPDNYRLDAALIPGAAITDAKPDAAESDATVQGGSEPEFEPGAADDVSLGEEALIQELATIGRQSDRRRGRRLLDVLLLLIVLGAGGWLAYDRYGVDIAGYVELLDGFERTATAVEPEADAVDGPRPIDILLPYSVVIATFDSRDAAVQRVGELTEDFGNNMVFYIAPVLVDGTVYFRMLAGPLADVITAEALMQRLVETGVMETEQPWAVRNTAWAYHLGDFDTRQAAVTRQGELREMGVPNYLVEVPYTAGPSRYRLYAGAYAGAAEAEVMARVLEEAEIEAPLVRRVGQPTR